jgi:hypothetical protein
MRIRHVLVLVGVFVLGTGVVPVAGAVIDALDCNRCVDTTDLRGSAVTSTKLKDGAVKTADLGADAVTTAKLKSGSVQRTTIKSGAVSLKKLTPGLLMAGRVNSDGTLIAGTEGVSAQRTGTGRYNLAFPVSIAQCVMTATHTAELIESLGSSVNVATRVSVADDHALEVNVWSTFSEAFQDHDVSVIVVCP